MIINISRICTGNNTIRTAWDAKNNKTIKTISAGRIGLKGARRGSPYASELVGREIGQTIYKKLSNAVLQDPIFTQEGIERPKVNDVKPIINIYLAGKMVAIGSGIRGIRIGLNNVTINEIVDVSPKPHNGCRARKARRV